MQPKIALTLGDADPIAAHSQRNYVDALERAGAHVVVVRPGEALPADVDGLCLSGGPDVHPRRYGRPDLLDECDTERIDERRDETEIGLATRALDLDIPILGICRGFQLLNVARGGSLITNVDGHRAADQVRHDIEPQIGSRLAKGCGARPFSVNSRHHQAVTRRTLGEGLRATAELDGLVEAFEADDRRWVVGVQWHPERPGADEVDEAARQIFGAFVSEASRVATPKR